jgi:hypothetical protein
MAVVTGGRSAGIACVASDGCATQNVACRSRGSWLATYLVRSIVPQQDGRCNGKVRFVCRSYVFHEVTLMTGFASFSRKINHQERLGRAH